MYTNYLCTGVYTDVTWRTRHTLDAGTVEGQIVGATVPKIGDDHMAKLYWRIKRNGKWTWVAATSENTRYNQHPPVFIGSAQKILGYDYDRYDGDAQEIFKPEVIAVEEEVCFTCETVGEEHCNVHRPYE